MGRKEPNLPPRLRKIVASLRKTLEAPKSYTASKSKLITSISRVRETTPNQFQFTPKTNLTKMRPESMKSTNHTKESASPCSVSPSTRSKPPSYWAHASRSKCSRSCVPVSMQLEKTPSRTLWKSNSFNMPSPTANKAGKVKNNWRKSFKSALSYIRQIRLTKLLLGAYLNR